ncbi:hypothetical protein VA7868_04534 [Vibrio aerogenes CECT 7868]|uniref:Uncharacterized protein n=1 Tax=Vibrio aerogenes CECT 7868 TaxID=1216006 RepID=A0A1M6EWG1_9VIBR|nr:hypothetical protein [Vibrio aerogenes]SHI89753.1 hypothetical protein VA7868_04534 [Vibrio aerogenes CECT 7868]
MFETIPYDPELAQKARELLLEFQEKMREKDMNTNQMYQFQCYMNNLITAHSIQAKALEESVSGL